MSSRRIAINTLATYGQTVFGLALGLFSGRWLFQALGDVDYGLMGVVGAMIVFIMFLSRVSTNAVARFLALSIGRGDVAETNRWFNTALSVHVLLPAVLILVGWPVGEWAIHSFFNVPAMRMETACWVFRFSLVSAFWGMSITPFLAMFVAKQQIFEISICSIVGAIINFAFVFLLRGYPGDKWLLYSAGTVLIAMAIGVFQILRARRLFPETAIHMALWWDRCHLRQLMSFAGWNMIGSLAAVLRSHGTAILLNKHFDPTLFPAVNSAYAVGTNVSNYTQMLSNALMGAITPEITSTEGRGERERMLVQANRASKFGVALVALFAIPLMLEIEFVLQAWLVTPPAKAGTFCRLVLVTFLLDKITFGSVAAINARGKIASYQMVQGSLLLLTLPIAWGLLRAGYPPFSVCWAFVATMAFCSFGRVLWANKLVGLSPGVWLRDALVPSVFMLLVGGSVGYCVLRLQPTPSWARLGMTILLTGVSWIACLLAVTLSRSERASVLQMLPIPRFRK